MRKKEKSKVSNTVLETIPILRYNENTHFFEMESEIYHYVDILRVMAKDRTGMDYDDIELENLAWEKFYLTYSDDIKILALNFPVDTSEQCSYYEGKIAKTKNPVFRKYLMKELAIYQNIGINKTNREFMMMIFGKTEKELDENIEFIDQYLGVGENGRVKYLSKEEKISVYHMLLNKCLMTRRK